MQKFFAKINELSYPTALFIAGFLSILVLLPLLLVLSREKTTIVSRAAVPTAMVTPFISPSPAPIPIDPPVITRMVPWIGKIGDACIIEGKNFGTQSKLGTLKIGDTIVTDANISEWTDTRITFSIPEGIINGSTVSLTVGTHNPATTLPLSVMSPTATVVLNNKNNIPVVNGITEPVTVTVWTTIEGQTTPQKQTIPVTPDSNGNVMLSTIIPSSIQSLLLTNTAATLIPYRIPPFAFGF